MRDQIEEALKGYPDHHIEIRIEEIASTHLRYRGRELEDIGKSTSVGGGIRALVNGGWGFVCFNNLTDLRGKVSMAVRQASMVNGEPFTLAPTEPIVDLVPADVKKDPQTVPLVTKKGLLDQYVDIMWSVPGVQSTSIMYGDGRSRVCFANNQGSYIEQEKVDVMLRLGAQARDGGEVQQSGVSLGSQRGTLAL